MSSGGGRDTAVPSPCVGTCQLDADRRYCTGCWRTIGEITAWQGLDAAAKRLVWEALEARRRAASLRPGPRA